MKSRKLKPGLISMAWMVWWCLVGTTIAQERAPSPPPGTDLSTIAGLEARMMMMKRRLQTMESEMDVIIKASKNLAAQKQPAAVSGNLSGEVAEKLEEMNERLTTMEDDVENILGGQDKLVESTKKDRLNITGSYRVTMNNFWVTDHTPDPQLDHFELFTDANGQVATNPVTGDAIVVPKYLPYKRNLHEAYPSNWVNRFRMVMTWDITENLRFYGAMVVQKYFNELKTMTAQLDMHYTRYPRDPTMKLERAYFDWFITDWLVFSAGRVASPEGPPLDLKENTPRDATWGAQMINAEMETVMLTFHLSRFLENTFLRIYTMPFTSHETLSVMDDLSLLKSDLKSPHMDSWSGLFETKVPGLGDNVFQLGWVHVPDMRPRNMAVSVSWLKDPVYPEKPSGDSLGTYFMANTLLEVKDFLQTGFDFFGAYALDLIKPSKSRMKYNVPAPKLLDVINPTTGAVATQVDTIPYEIGMASYDDVADPTGLHVGHMFYVGARYTLPLSAQYPTRFGAEYNQGTKWHVGWESPSDLLVKKLSTKGYAGEVYVIQQLVPDHLFMRVGYIYQMRKFDGTYIGPSKDLDISLHNVYTLIDASW